MKKENKKEETKKDLVTSCSVCKGSGRGPLLGLQETSCETCQGTGIKN